MGGSALSEAGAEVPALPGSLRAALAAAELAAWTGPTASYRGGGLGSCQPKGDPGGGSGRGQQ